VGAAGLAGDYEPAANSPPDWLFVAFARTCEQGFGVAGWTPKPLKLTSLPFGSRIPANASRSGAKVPGLVSRQIAARRWFESSPAASGTIRGWPALFRREAGR
jgi:hypothetical protein